MKRLLFFIFYFSRSFFLLAQDAYNLHTIQSPQDYCEQAVEDSPDIFSNESFSKKCGNLPPTGNNLLYKERLDRDTHNYKLLTNFLEKNDQKKEEKKQSINAQSLEAHRLESQNSQKDSVKKTDTEAQALTPALIELLSGQYCEPPLDTLKIAYHFKELTIQEALAALTRVTGLAFIIDEQVSGFVHNVELPECSLGVALQILLTNNSPRLALVKQYDVFRIMTEAQAVTLCSYKAQELEKSYYMYKSHTVLHAKWDESFKKQCESLWQGITKEDSQNKNIFFTFDDQSKTFFFRAKKKDAMLFAQALKKLDQRLPQVRIDIRVIIANKSFEDSFGIEWSGIYDRQASVKHFDFAGIGPLIQEDNPTYDFFKKLITWTVNILPPVSNALPMVSLPFVFANNNVDNPKRLHLFLNASENRNLIKTILKPSLLVSSSEIAEILVGEELPQETRVDEAIEGKLTNVTTTYYKDIGMKIKVQPIVHHEKKELFLDVYVENSTVVPRHVEQPRASRGLLNYTIETARSKSKTILKSGQTTMIGGLMTQVREKQVVGVPFLQDIPIIGNLFKGKRTKLVDKELMIFITPTIV